MNILYKLLATIIAFLQLIFPFISVSPPTAEAGISRIEENTYTYYYPENAVHSAKADVIYEFLSRGENPTTFDGENNGREGSGIVFSPYFEAYIGDSEIPVYSTPVYSASTESVELHSYATVFVDGNAPEVLLTLETYGFSVKKAVVLPEFLNITPSIDVSGVNAKFNSFGTYSFMFNENDQRHAFTLFLKPYVDENKEIAELKKEYGEENVTVFEPGVHTVDYLDIQKDSSILYLKSGSVLLANHKYEMTAPEQDWEIVEDDAPQNNCLGLYRYPVINFYNCKNVKLLGNGTIDMTQLDWLERRGVVFSMCDNIEMRDTVLLNAPAWTMVAHCCDGVEIENVAVFGYRTNSDAIAITNTQNAIVSDCFARSGDDLFEVKTLRTNEPYETKNILFENCYGWNGKARCFGVTHEVNYPVSDVIFRNCAVIYRDAIWDNDTVCSLAVQVGEGGATVKNILFENIEIYKDHGRPINVLVMSDKITSSVIEGVTFRNIKWDADMKAQLEAVNGNTVDVSFENITANSVSASDENTSNWLENNGAFVDIGVKSIRSKKQ